MQKKERKKKAVVTRKWKKGKLRGTQTSVQQTCHSQPPLEPEDWQRGYVTSDAQKSKIAARRSEGSERACKTLNTLMACGCPYTLVSLQWELGVQNTKFKCETPNILPRGRVFLLARQWCKCQRVDVFKVDSFSLVGGTLGLALVFPPTTDGCYQSHTEYLFRVCELASTSRVASLVSLGSRLPKLPFPFS